MSEHWIYITALVSGCLVIWVLVGYPLMAAVMCGLFRRRHGPRYRLHTQPSVSVIVAAHNEAHNIARRLQNILEQDYPEDRLEVIVVCDGCSDETADVAAEFDNVTVLELRNRQGKASALNEGVAMAQGEVLVLTDARPLFEKDAIRNLVECLFTERAGVASGVLKLVAPAGRPRGSDLYWRMETALLGWESGWVSASGCCGPITAVRSSVWAPIPRDTINEDEYLALQSVRRDWRVVQTPHAVAWDRAPHSYAVEFARKTRTSHGNWQLWSRWRWVRLPRRNRLWFQFLSHRLGRLLLPWLLLIFVASALATGINWLVTTAYIVLAVVGVGLLGLMLPGLGRWLPGVGVLSSFVLMMGAAMAGWWRFVRNMPGQLWESSPIEQIEAVPERRRVG